MLALFNVSMPATPMPVVNFRVENATDTPANLTSTTWLEVQNHTHHRLQSTRSTMPSPSLGNARSVDACALAMRDRRGLPDGYFDRVEGGAEVSSTPEADDVLIEPYRNGLVPSNHLTHLVLSFIFSESESESSESASASEKLQFHERQALVGEAPDVSTEALGLNRTRNNIALPRDIQHAEYEVARAAIVKLATQMESPRLAIFSVRTLAWLRSKNVMYNKMIGASGYANNDRFFAGFEKTANATSPATSPESITEK